MLGKTIGSLFIFNMSSSLRVACNRFHLQWISAHWDEKRHKWKLHLRSVDLRTIPKGTEKTADIDIYPEHDVLISAIGSFSIPQFPNIPDRKTFEGSAFHSAQWNHKVDLSGKNVVVVGTAAR